MVVITLEKCPLALRGDLTKWLQEISLGVYVGQVSARVRDNLWQRVCEECKNGRATMVFSARNEQHYDFRVHNTSWEPIDFDGIKLMMRPSPSRVKSLGKKRTGFSNAARYRKARKRSGVKSLSEPREYVVIDIETTGLNPNKDEIIELAAIKVVNGSEVNSFNCLVKPSKTVSSEILKLTGLRSCDLEKGRDLRDALDDFISFIGNHSLVAHNAQFDIDFLQSAIVSIDEDELENEVIDTLTLARKRMTGLSSYSLQHLAYRLHISMDECHRALSDAETTRQLFLQLIEK